MHAIGMKPRDTPKSTGKVIGQGGGNKGRVTANG